MKKQILRLAFWFLLSGVFVISCKKDPSEIKPDPTEPPVSETELKFPGKEMRAVWITTAWGLDWPLGDYSTAGQKQKYINYLDKFKELNINAVFFQVKGMGDAYYSSSYEPWSVSITGSRGKDPGYDVLQFLIDEAHARDIEFHAWMNPYRIATRAAASTAYPALHPSVSADWVVSHEKIQIYNPAIPQVRERLADIVKELITRYNVDGVHFDDYFYPAPSAAGQMVSDQADYEKYGNEYPRVEDFRISNVDKTIQIVNETIVAVKPEVVFSVSPAPNNTTNLNSLFADVSKWCREGWLDIVIPQLYQEIGNPYNDYTTNLRWWVQNSAETPVMVGHGFYKFGDPTMPTAFQSSDELQKQFDISYGNNKIVGNAQYSARYLLDNKIGITDKLADIYHDKAVMPFLGREVASKPSVPGNVRLEGGKLKWSAAAENRTVVYYFKNLTEIGRVMDLISANEISVSEKGYYCVRNLNSDNLESDASEIIELK